MKLSHVILTKSSPFRNVSRASTVNQNPTYSTVAATATSRSPVSKRNIKKAETSLYKIISPIGNPNESIVPILDQWIRDGNTTTDTNLRYIIKELRHYRRFNHALQVSKWMSEKRFIPLTAGDVAIRLDLIAKIHGIEAAENYFKSTSTKLRTLEVYGAFLNCFSHAKCVDKAEDVMQKMRDFGFASYSMSYNVMLSLYCRTANRGKLEALLLEMETKKIKFDSYTYSILLNAYGGDGDIDGLARVLTKMESDPGVNIDWITYAVSAKQYLKAQLVDKGLESLKKSERFISFSKKRNEAYSHIITLYATAGKKDDVLRLWEQCKTYKVTNRDYISILPSVLKFNDFETAEKILKDWEDSYLLKDIRMPNFLISSYCQNGLVEKAEALLEKVKTKNWQKANSFTWSWMAFGYVKSDQMSKAVETMEFALEEVNPQVCWKARGPTLAACLKYLKDEGHTERLTKNMEMLKDKCLIPVKIHERLVEYLEGKCAVEDVFKKEHAIDSEEVGTQETG